MSPLSCHAQCRALFRLAIAVGFVSPMVGAAQPLRANRLAVQVVATGDSTVHMVTVANVLGHDLMAYRFRVDVTEPDMGAAAGAPWELAILVGGDHEDGGVRLTARGPDVTLPRPLGVRIGAGDSVRVVLSFPEGRARALALRVSIEYEPLDRPECRIAVVAVSARWSSESAAAGRWDWTVRENGRLLAVAGLPLGSVSSVTLSEVETGVTLWSTTHDRDLHGAFRSAGAALRLGVPLVAGTTYRLTVTFAGAATAAANTGVEGRVSRVMGLMHATAATQQAGASASLVLPHP